MTKAQLRTAGRTYVRDAGTAKHWTDAALDEWFGVTLDWLVSELISANEDWYNEEQEIQTGSDGSFDLSVIGAAPSALTKEFYKPIGLVRRRLTDTGGIPYVIDRPREHMIVKPTGTYHIRQKKLIVNPRQENFFTFQYVYWPARWSTLAEGVEPDFPDEHHRLIGLETAVAALTEGGRDAPGPLAEVAGRLRERWQGFIGRHNEEGPITCRTYDDAWTWGSI